MTNVISAEDRSLAKQALATLIRLENQWPNTNEQVLTSTQNEWIDLEIAQKAMRELALAKHPELQRLTKLSGALKNPLSVHSLMSCIVALERLLELKTLDSNFLIAHRDSIESWPKLDEKVSVLPLILVLDNLRSAFNVGAIFRTADCLKVDHVFLTGYTATPEQDAVRKSAMGSCDHLPWTYIRRIEMAFELLKKDGYRIFALETAEPSSNLYKTQWSNKTALVLGNERFGLGIEVLSQSDEVLRIPVLGKKNSLNVATALAVAGFEFRRKQLFAYRS